MKNFFYRETYKRKYKKYISHFRNIFLHRKNICVTKKIQKFYMISGEATIRIGY